MASTGSEYASMAFPVAGTAAAAYLLLLARSAWRQGELRQFAVSLLILLGLGGGLAAIVAVYIRLFG